MVGAAEYLPNTVWLLDFLEHQGYQDGHKHFYQDNESAIKLKKYGKRSSSRKSRHFNIKLFNIKDKVKAHQIDITHCPTQSMVADFFTKPLQGAQFRLLRDVILGRTPLSSLPLPPTVKQVDSKERVEIPPVSNNNNDDSTISQLPPKAAYADVVRGLLKETK